MTRAAREKQCVAIRREGREPSFPGPEMTPGAKICGVGPGEDGAAAFWAGAGRAALP